MGHTYEGFTVESGILCPACGAAAGEPGGVVDSGGAGVDPPADEGLASICCSPAGIGGFNGADCGAPVLLARIFLANVEAFGSHSGLRFEVAHGLQ